MSARTSYAVVHLVAQEALKDLIAPQVIDHMAIQVATLGDDKPERIVVGFLEPVRHALKSSVRQRLRIYRKRAPDVHVALLPFVSRAGRSANAGVLGIRLRRLVGQLPIVFHCRSESAVDWAIEFSRLLRPSGIVVDIRGAWPEELLFARGFDGPGLAPLGLQQQFRSAEERLRRALDTSASALTVSQSLVAYLIGLGAVPDQVAYVPCCVRSTTFSSRRRGAMRAQLGLDGKIVFAYAGTVTRYQHVDDGLLAFFRLVADHAPDAHLLCLTGDVETMSSSISAAGISSDRVTLRSVAQQEMPTYLAAADAGVLLRAPSRMNRFSQPTKFAEYLAAGLPVVVSRGTGVLDTMLETSGAGFATDWFEADLDRRRVFINYACTRLRECGEQLREAALALCEREFLWSNHVTTVRRAYFRALRK